MFNLLKKLKEEKDWKEGLMLRRQIVAAAKDSRQELSQALLSEKDMHFKIELLNLIGDTKDEFFAEQVEEVIRSAESVEVLQTAATTLGKTGGPNSFETLAGLLSHKSPNARLGAIYGLMALGDKRAIKHLLKSLADQSPVKCWWPSPKPDGYVIAKEASIAIDELAGIEFKGDKARIEEWLAENTQ